MPKIHIVLAATATLPHADELRRRGERVLMVLPQSLRPAVGPAHAEAYFVTSWDAYSELRELATRLSDVEVASVTSPKDVCQTAAAFLRGLLGVPGMSWEASVVATDKLRQKQVLRRAGINVAPFVSVRSLADVPAAAALTGWPLILKRRSGANMVGTTWIDSEDHLHELAAGGDFSSRAVAPGMEAAHFDQPLEQLADGLLIEAALDVVAEFHCELLRWKGTEVYALPGRYPAPLLRSDALGAVLLPGHTEEAQAVLSLARQAADALHLRSGFAHIEVLRTRDGRWWLGELGLRPSGGRVCTMVALQHPGIDIYSLQADLAMGLPPVAQTSPDNPPVAWAARMAPQGLIVEMTPAHEILRRPGIIAAESAVSVGDLSVGQIGTATFGAHVFATGDTPEDAYHRASAAAAAWEIRALAAPTPSLQS
jgi:biotin carboxylase